MENRVAHPTNNSQEYLPGENLNRLGVLLGQRLVHSREVHVDTRSMANDLIETRGVCLILVAQAGRFIRY